MSGPFVQAVMASMELFISAGDKWALAYWEAGGTWPDAHRDTFMQSIKDKYGPGYGDAWLATQRMRTGIRRHVTTDVHRSESA